MNKAKIPLLIALSVLLAASACLTTLPATAPAPSMSSINLTATSLAQFLTSAPRTTVIATQPAPTETAVITTTPFASITPLPTATATFTNTPIGFVASATAVPPTVAGATAEVTPDPAEGATDDWGSDFRCTLIGKTPADWTEVPPSGKYKVSWTLLNSGHKKWQADGIELAFMDDKNLSRDERKTSLVSDVKVNGTTTPVINIYPPSAPGNYRSVWGLRLIKTGHVFCTFTIKITVK